MLLPARIKPGAYNNEAYEMSGVSYGFDRRAVRPVATAAAIKVLRCWKGLLATVLVVAVLALVYVYNLDYRGWPDESAEAPAVSSE